MKNKRFFLINRHVISWIFFVLTVAACAGQPDVSSRSWIDFPREGSRLVVGTPVPITAHLYGRDGVQAYQVSINGVVFEEGIAPDQSQDFIEISQEWIPDHTGDFLIQVTSLGAEREELSRADVHVSVFDFLTTPDLTVNNLSLIDGEKIRCSYENLGGTTAPKGRDVWMDIFMGPSESELERISHSNIGVDNVFQTGLGGSLTTAAISPIPEWPQMVKCVIDVGDLLPESNEDNNEIQMMLSEPDLTVSALAVVDGEKIQCTYGNLGGVTAPEGRDVWMDIFVGPSESEMIRVSHSNIGVDRDFDAGMEGAFTSAALSPIPEWPQMVKCVIDAGDLLPESDEENNEIQIMLSEPDLTVTNLSIVDENKVRCYYGNLGGNTAPEGRDVWLDIFMGPTESELERVSRNNIGLDRIFEADMAGNLTTAPMDPVPEWPQLVVCEIDAGDLLPEADEDNNQISMILGESDTETATPTPTPTVTVYLPEPPTNTPRPTSTPRPTNTTRPDDVPPRIEKMNASADPISEPPCQPDSVTITAEVTDSSGLQAVRLYYRVVKDDIIGDWVVVDMGTAGNQMYSRTLGPSDLRASRNPYGGLILQYYIKAWDNAGNTAETKSGNVHISVCVQ